MDAKENGVTYLDKLCHKLYDMPKGTGYRILDNCRGCGGMLEAYYCEERLYLVRCIGCGSLSLVKAGSPVEAAAHTLGTMDGNAHIDQEALCGEWQGEADGYADEELVYDVWRCGDCGHVEETDDPDLLPRFCPSCGRAMMPEAWAALKKRLLRLEGPEAIAEKADRDYPSVPSPLAGEPLTQSDLDEMHFERVWIDYGQDESGERSGEEGVVLYGRLYSIDTLDGAGLEELLLDAISGETLNNPTGTYTAYRRPTNGKEIEGCHD